MEQKENKTMASAEYKRRIKFTVNIALLLSGIAMSLSGLVLQCNYHLLRFGAETDVLALNRAQWNAVHVWTSFGFTAFAAYHIWAHRVWYRSALKKNSKVKKRSQNSVLATLLFVVVISGLTALSIFISGGNPGVRFSIVEVHDKAAILFFIIAVLHTAKRFGRIIRK